jgi:hypothetical protein
MGNDMNGVKVSKESFSNLDHSTQNTILFENTEKILSLFEAQICTCNEKFDKIEKRKRFDTGIGGASGLIGGIIAQIASWTIFKG